jgi:GntR family histidine utilization transcriptional repressor
MLPDKRAQKLLKVGPAEPCLMLTRRTWVAGVPVTRSSFVHPGSRYSLGSRHKL